MAFYQFQRKQVISASIDEVWHFISSPQNLKRITPPEMGFDIRTPDLPDEMYAGMIIGYTVRPLWNIPTTWVTEITQVESKRYFVDEQRIGPYKIWHHQHLLEATSEGVLMSDIISYQPPLGVLGTIANRFVIRKKLEAIFDFRHTALEAIFRK
jgi:ligand-binding SRPBCC domain-containing protein